MPDNHKTSISHQVIILAIPIIFSNLSRVIMGLADMAMVSRLGVNALAATGMGSLILWAIMSIGIGIRTAVQTVSSRRLGQKKHSECTNALYNGIILAVIVSIPFTIMGTNLTPDIASLFLNNTIVLLLCTEYLFIGFFGIIFIFIAFAFQGFYAGIEETRIHMVVTILSNLLNIYLNAGFIYGSNKITSYFFDFGVPWLAILWNWAPFPALGVKGAAIATLIASICAVIFYIIYLFSSRIKIFCPFGFKLIFSNLVQQVKLGFPIGIQEMISMMGFTVFYKIIGMIGTVELATSHVILNIAHASFMPAIGVGMAASTLIGKFLGENNADKADRTVKEALKWSLLIMGTGGLFFILFPGWIISVFSNDPHILKFGKPCLQIIGGLQYFDAIGLTLFFVLTGAGNTRFPALVNMSICWLLFLPLSYYLGIVMEMGVIGAWLGFAAWIIPFAIIMSLKVRTGSWKLIEV